jgi:hypothetical protein
MHTYILQGMVAEHAKDLRGEADAARLVKLVHRKKRETPAGPAAVRARWRPTRGAERS